MNDYSDIFFLIGAMMLFAILTTNVSRSMVMNNQKLSQSEVEYEGIALAHSLIEDAQWASKNELNPGNSAFIFQGYTDQNNPKHKKIKLGASGEYTVDFYLYATVKDTSISGSNTDNKVVDVWVTSPYMTDSNDNPPTEYPIKLKFVKSFKN